MSNDKFDYGKLSGKIVEKYGNIKKYCETTGHFAYPVLTRILRNETKLSAESMFILINDLDIEDEEIRPVFFKNKVQMF